MGQTSIWCPANTFLCSEGTQYPGITTSGRLNFVSGINYIPNLGTISALLFCDYTLSMHNLVHEAALVCLRISVKIKSWKIDLDLT